MRHPERPRFLVDPRLQPGAAKPRAEGSPVQPLCPNAAHRATTTRIPRSRR